jgi:hypothetical protein
VRARKPQLFLTFKVGNGQSKTAVIGSYITARVVTYRTLLAEDRGRHTIWYSNRQACGCIGGIENCLSSGSRCQGGRFRQGWGKRKRERISGSGSKSTGGRRREGGCIGWHGGQGLGNMQCDGSRVAIATGTAGGEQQGHHEQEPQGFYFHAMIIQQPERKYNQIYHLIRNGRLVDFRDRSMDGATPYLKFYCIKNGIHLYYWGKPSSKPLVKTLRSIRLTLDKGGDHCILSSGGSGLRIGSHQSVFRAGF